MVPLQENLKDLKLDLREDKKEHHIGQRQVLEAHKQALLQGRRHEFIQAALRQRCAEVAGLRDELRQWVRTPALAPACWS